VISTEAQRSGETCIFSNPLGLVISTGAQRSGETCICPCLTLAAARSFSLSFPQGICFKTPTDTPAHPRVAHPNAQPTTP
jgi:hypothetical protein